MSNMTKGSAPMAATTEAQAATIADNKQEYVITKVSKFQLKDALDGIHRDIQKAWRMEGLVHEWLAESAAHEFTDDFKAFVASNLSKYETFSDITLNAIFDAMDALNGLREQI